MIIIEENDYVFEPESDYQIKIKLSPLKHHEENQIKIDFPKDEKLISLLKQIENVKWSSSNKCWYILNKPENLRKIFGIFRGCAWVDAKELFEKTRKPEIQAISEKPMPAKLVFNQKLSKEITVQIEVLTQKMKSKWYSESTIKTYTESLKTFFRFYHDKKAAEITNSDITRFNVEYIIANNYSTTLQNQVVNALKLFYKITENREINIDLIERPKRAYKLPNVLSKEEVTAILKAHVNIKHRVMLSLIYSCGLRRSELLNLKPLDVDSNRNLLIIRNAKGNKDRIVPLSLKTLEMLRNYYKLCKTVIWLLKVNWKVKNIAKRVYKVF